MPEDVRPPRPNEVDQPVAIDVEQVLPVAAINQRRMPPDSAKRPRGAVDAAGNGLLGTGEFGLAAGAWHG